MIFVAFFLGGVAFALGCSLQLGISLFFVLCAEQILDSIQTV